MTNETKGQAIITIQQLRSKRACDRQVELFQAIWGDRVDVEEAEFLEHATQFDWFWGADVLLPRPMESLFRNTEEDWYSTWKDRSTEYARPADDAYQALRRERREKVEEADQEGKYDEVYDSYDKLLDAAHTLMRATHSEGAALWFARLYREACGITTDEWQLKERADETERRKAEVEAIAAGLAGGTPTAEQTAEGDELDNVVERDSDISTGGNDLDSNPDASIGDEVSGDSRREAM